MKRIYVGLALNIHTLKIEAISAAKDKETARNLADKWLQENDNDGLDFKLIGCSTIRTDYIDID